MSQFIAYLITCTVDGKQYVGITKRSVSRRWLEHLSDALNGKMTALHVAIRKHGECSFTVREVCCAWDAEGLCAIEIALIKQYGTRSPNGYNLDGGGKIYSYTKSADSIERSAAKHRGKVRNATASERAAQKLRGLVRSTETRRKMADARRGVPRPESVKRKLSEWRKGKSFNSGEANGQSKLTAGQVREARVRLSVGESQRSIARSFGIHYGAIWKIANGKKWKAVL